MKPFLRRLFASYAVVLFLLLLALSVPYMLVNFLLAPADSALRRNIHFLHHRFTPLYLFLIGVRTEVEGLEKLDPQQSYVIIANHRSSLDFIVNASVFPGIFRFLAKHELTRVPVFGWVVKNMCLTVDRRDPASRTRSVQELKRALENGWSIFIYPEGGRNRSADKLGPFYDGAFRIARETGSPLAIQIITNIEAVAPTTRANDLRPGTLRVVWETPIHPNHHSVGELKELAKNLMLQHIR